MSEEKTKAKRQPKAVKTVDEEARSVSIDFSNGESVSLSMDEVPEAIQNRLALHGLSQKLGDSYASIKTVEGSIEACMSVKERLVIGDWVKAREGAGARPTLVVQAVIRALEADGQTVDDERRKAIMDKLSDKAERDAALENPVIDVHYQAIRAEAAKERATKAKAKAKTEGGDLTGF